MSIIYESVKKFYEEIPFNYEESASEQAETIRAVNQIEAYLPLARCLSENPGAKILEIGCGTGWFSNSAAYWYGINVLGVDCCLKAVEQARAAAEELSISDKVQIICHDLFELPGIVQTEFDVVNSLGVLHHTKDCFEGLKIAASMLKSGGYLNIGLYHRFGRHALLEMFRPIRERLLHADTPSQREAIEREGFELWKNLHNRSFSDVFLKSWYRDQCLHPHETQWTLKDVLEWFSECGIEPLNTSLDQFSENPDWDRLVETEHEQYELGRKRLLFEKKFFPGFFVVGGRKGKDITSCRHGINREDVQNKIKFNNREESGAVSHHHAAFSLFKCSGDKPGKGWLHDFLGVRTREIFFKHMENYDSSSYPDYDEQYFEWTDVLEAACSASGRFVMIELGAGWGRWLIRAATALGKINPVPCLLIGVEAEPDHYRWMMQHFLDNSVDPGSHQLIEAAVSDRDGKVMFHTGSPDECYGQAIAEEMTEPFSIKEVRSVSLSTLLAPLDSVDLIDLDVQGAELSVLSAASAELDRKVKKVHIGTHSLQVEKGLRSLFGRMGWVPIYDFPCGGTSSTQYGDIYFQDGVQTWINPKLLSHRQLPDAVVRIMGVSFLEEIQSEPGLIRLIPKINKYLGMGKTSLALNIIKSELGRFNKALQILSGLDKYNGKQQKLVDKQERLVDFVSRTRDKWREIPSTREGRIFSAELLTMPDEQVLEYWERCRASTHHIRNWYQEKYKGVFRGKEVLDVGCGLGIDSIFFAQNDARVTCADIVIENLQVVERICRIKGIHAEFQYIEDLTNYRFQHSFDVIMFIGSMHHAPFELSRKEIRSCMTYLRPGGKVVMLAYPYERYKQTGARDFAEFGRLTDGERTPWAEWYDDSKINALFGPQFHIDESRNFGQSDIEFNWFELTKLITATRNAEGSDSLEPVCNTDPRCGQIALPEADNRAGNDIGACGQDAKLTFIKTKELTMNTVSHDLAFTPAQAYWNQRFVLQAARERILALSDAVNNKTDLWPYQLAQLMAAALEFKPDLILELGRGKGNSTCGFTEVANHLNKNGGNCRIVSLCISEDWEKVTQWQVLKFVDDKWFNPLTALRGNILTFDYDSIFKGVKRCLLFWDAHGFDVAECVLGRILPGIAGMSNLVIMHDLSDTRYIPPDTALYKGNRIWRGNDWSGPRLRLGYIDSSVEQAVAIVDFTSRNNIPFDSADHSFDMGIKSDGMKYKEMQEVLGGDLFNLGAHWFWFTLNGAEAPLTFPLFQAPVMKDHIELNMYEQIRIMDVSLRDTVLTRPDRADVIKRINNYLKMGKPGLASRIVEKEFGHLKEASEILSKINKYDNETKVIMSGQCKGEGY